MLHVNEMMRLLDCASTVLRVSATLPLPSTHPRTTEESQRLAQHWQTKQGILHMIDKNPFPEKCLAGSAALNIVQYFEMRP